MEWYEKIGQEDVFAQERCFLLVVTTKRSYSPLFYVAADSGFTYSDDFLDQGLDEDYEDALDALTEQAGIHIFQYEKGRLTDRRYIPFYNVELSPQDACELALYQEYGLSPVEEEREAVLKKSVKAEKIKDTLVYACYENDTEKILARAGTAKSADLNKKLGYHGDPLSFAVEHNNAAAFRALAERGADLTRRCLGSTPLELAFLNDAREIVFYIYEDHREQFDKEVAKKGFAIAYDTRDRALLQLLLDCGCDMSCAGKQFQPLHNFADYNNLEGIRFLADHGVDLGTKNKEGLTALERAARQGRREAEKLLKELAEAH